MTMDATEHAKRVQRGDASVIVASNLSEGYDGVGDLCRFVIMPKVPFPSLGDARTKLRQEQDSRSYDHRALVSVVQGAGRGVRHSTDTADTWILDRAWEFLYTRWKEWLPESFLDSYQHRVKLPG